MAIKAPDSTKQLTRKALIYETAALAFRDRGYLATSMRQIASEVGLEVSSLYSHIRSKEELLNAICLQCAQQFTEGILEIQRSGDIPTHRLRQVIALHAHIAQEDPTSITVFNDEWRHMHNPQLEQFLMLRKTYESELAKIIGSGISSGELVSCDPQIMQSTFLSALQWMHRSTRMQEKNTERIVEEIGAILLDGMIARK